VQHILPRCTPTWCANLICYLIVCLSSPARYEAFVLAELPHLQLSSLTFLQYNLVCSLYIVQPLLLAIQSILFAVKPHLLVILILLAVQPLLYRTRPN
jgi:hypothetical protein